MVVHHLEIGERMSKMLRRVCLGIEDFSILGVVAECVSKLLKNGGIVKHDEKSIVEGRTDLYH